MKDILKREMDFHNRRFSHGLGERAQGKYYFALTRWENDLSELLPSRSVNCDVLEYGCGPAPRMLQFVSEGIINSWSGIDVSREAVNKVNEIITLRGVQDRANILCGDAHSSDFQDDQFDFIFGSGILHHLDVELAAQELVRIAKQDSTLVFAEPLGFNPFINAYRWLTPNSRSSDEHPFVSKDFDILKRHFIIERFEVYGFFSLISVPFRGQKVGGLIKDIGERIDSALLKYPGGLYKAGWMSTIVMSPIAK